MTTLLTILHVLVCLFLVGIVLLQHGKGADVGATFGGSSQSLFGTEGPLPLLNKITTAAAVVFMLTSVTLAYISSSSSSGSLMSDVPAVQVPAVPEAEKAKDIVVPMSTPTETQEEKPEGIVKPEGEEQKSQ
ncbi:MAG: preprotein translocase subunit SecG [Thermodesulfobacteriota bacterium]